MNVFPFVAPRAGAWIEAWRCGGTIASPLRQSDEGEDAYTPSPSPLSQLSLPMTPPKIRDSLFPGCPGLGNPR